MPRSDVQTIRFEVVASQGDANDPHVSILVDGERVFERFDRGYIGLDPDSLFVPGSPLLPVDPPARVAPYSCSCGETGCGCIAPVISSRGADLIVWSDPRDFTGVFPNRASRQYPDPDDGVPLPIGELVFDRAQYEAEVARATADRGWETPGRAVARRLRRLLAEERHALLPTGWDVGWTEHAYWAETEVSGPVFNVELHDGRTQRVLALHPRPRGAADPALDMVEQLREKPWDTWVASFGRPRR